MTSGDQRYDVSLVETNRNRGTGESHKAQSVKSKARLYGLSFFLYGVAIICLAGCGAQEKRPGNSSDVSQTGTVSIAAQSDAESLQPGGTCRTADDCVLSQTWRCTPCGQCPGAQFFVWNRHDLEALERHCDTVYSAKFRAQTACSPCPSSAPAPRPTPACLSGRCSARP